MDYRDERDALRGRVENLEQDLAEARHELEEARGGERDTRIAQLERKLGETQATLDAVRRELQEAKGTSLSSPTSESRGKPAPEEFSGGMIVGLLGLFGVPIAGVGLVGIAAHVLCGDEAPSPSLARFAAATAVGVTLFMVYVGAVRMEAQRLMLPVLARAVGWDVLQWATLADLVASAALMLAASAGVGPFPHALAVGLVASWLGVFGLAMFFAFAPRVRGDRPTAVAAGGGSVERVDSDPRAR